MFEFRKNPLLEAKTAAPTVDASGLKSPFSVRIKVPTAQEIKKLMRKETAQQAIGQIYPGCAIFGITKGQFSLIELISTILDQTDLADLFISTWTASGTDLTTAHDFLESGKIRSCRFLVDYTFQRRKPAFAAKIRELFGPDAVRVIKNHAKFSLIRNDKWNLVLKTSMNLNFNPRLEDFDLQDNPDLADFLQALMDEIFKKVKPKSLFDDTMTNERRFTTI